MLYPNFGSCYTPTSGHNMKLKLPELRVVVTDN
jgi:hypothetical protein